MSAPEFIRVRAAFRLLAGSVLCVRVGLSWSYLHAASVQLVAPVHDHFFPVILQQPALFLAAFSFPMVAEGLVLHAPSEANLKFTAVAETICAGVLLVHQATYFYATWVLVFWIALFMIWMAWSAVRDLSRVPTSGPFLAQLLIAFFFLGGAVGKWTSGYWSGAVFEELFFTRNAYSYLPVLRRFLDGATVHVLAVWFSRAVVVIESSMPLILVLPARIASTVSVVAAAGFWLASPDLFEVTLPLMGLALAGRILANPINSEDK